MPADKEVTPRVEKQKKEKILKKKGKGWKEEAEQKGIGDSK